MSLFSFFSICETYCTLSDAVRLMKQLYGIDMEQTQYSNLIKYF